MGNDARAADDGSGKDSAVAGADAGLAGGAVHAGRGTGDLPALRDGASAAEHAGRCGRRAEGGGTHEQRGVAAGIPESVGDGADRAVADAAGGSGTADPNAGAAAEPGPGVPGVSPDTRTSVSSTGTISDSGVNYAVL